MAKSPFQDLKVEQTEITTETRAWLVPPTSGIAKATTAYPLSTKDTTASSRLHSASARGAAGITEDPSSPSPADVIAVEVNSSEWLRGCPVGGEQSLLFGVYSQLRMHDVACPHCKHSNTRFPELDSSPSTSDGAKKIRESMKMWPADHLLLVFPRAEQLIEHILRAAHVNCQSCKGQFCAACGQKRKMELPSHDPSVKAPEGKPWNKKEREAVLYHCGAMQSIVLGCGLIMVDRYNAALARATDAELSAAAGKNLNAVLEFNGRPPQFTPSLSATTSKVAKPALGEAEADPVTGDFLLRMSTIVQPVSHDAEKKGGRSKREKRKGSNSPNKPERKKSSKTETRTSASKLKAPAKDPEDDSLDEDEDHDVDPYSHSYSYNSNKNKSAAGTGYSGSANETSNWKKTALAKQKRRDGLMEEMLATLRQFLPNAARGVDGMADTIAGKGKDNSMDDGDMSMAARASATDGGGSVFETDWMPDATTLAHLRRRFLPLASSLLSSDSLSDMIERQSLFVELLRWFTIFARHETLCPILAQPIMRVASVQPAVDKDGKKKDASEVLTTYAGSAGPMELVQSIMEQCKTFKEVLSTATKSTDPGDAAKVDRNALENDLEKQGSGDELEARELDPEEVRISAFCDRITSISQTIETQLRKTKGDAMVDKLLGRIKPSVKAPAKPTSRSQTAKAVDMTDEEEKTAYEDWARPLLFDDSSNMQASTSVDHTRYNHKYNSDIIACQSTPTRRTIAIAKELGNWNRSLPALFHGSIFLRRDESRIDVLKACIIGPEGSPYESGCYLFDIFLPADYNNAPPKCSIVNTGGGKYRHNPNLYADGKVCLSLLGCVFPESFRDEACMLTTFSLLQNLGRPRLVCRPIHTPPSPAVDPELGVVL